MSDYTLNSSYLLDIARGKKSWPTNIPAKAQRKLLVDFAQRQSSTTNNFFTKIQGSPLDLSIYSSDGSQVAPHSLASVQGYPEQFHSLQINDVPLTINPSMIKINQQNINVKDSILRAPGLAKNKSGRSVVSFTMSIPFVGQEEINQKLRRLVAQFRTIPFAYVENELIRQYVYPAKKQKHRSIAVAVTNFTVSTDPSSWEVLYLNINMELFNYTPYSPDFYYLKFPGMALSALTSKPDLSKGKKKSASNKRSRNEIPKDLVTKDPRESLLFTKYYDFILSNKSTNKTIKLNNDKTKGGTTQLITKGSRRHYRFEPAEVPFTGDLRFSYDIYWSLPMESFKASPSIPTTGSPSSSVYYDTSMSDNQTFDQVVSNIDLAYWAMKKLKGIKYGNPWEKAKNNVADRYKMGPVMDCSMLPLWILKWGPANLKKKGQLPWKQLGFSTTTQVAGIELLQQRAINGEKTTPYLKIKDGVIVPMPAFVFRGKDAASKAMMIPGVIGWEFGRKNGQSTFVHAMFSLGPANVKKGSDPTFKTLEAFNKNEKSGSRFLKIYPNGKTNNSELPTIAAFIPGVVYEYQGYEKHFDRLFDSFNLSSDLVALKTANSSSPTLTLWTADIPGKKYKSLKDAGYGFNWQWAYTGGGFKALAYQTKILVAKLKADLVAKKIQSATKKATPAKTLKTANAQNKKKKKSKVIQNAAASTSTTNKKNADVQRTKERALIYAKKAEEIIKKWSKGVDEFLKKNKQHGWKLVWQKDGTALFKKTVTFSIKNDDLLALGDDIVPNSISVGFSNNFARIPLTGHQYATHQYMGSGDGEASISFTIKGNKYIAALTAMEKYLEASARLLRRVPEAGVVTVRNEIINLVGGDKYIVDSLNISTLPDGVDVYSAQLNISEYNRSVLEMAKPVQEFAMSVDTKNALIKALVELHGQNVKTFVDYKNGKFKISQKGIPDYSFVLNYMRANNKPPKNVTAIDFVLARVNYVLSRYLDQIGFTDLFHLLGMTADDYRSKTNDSNHPYYIYGVFNNILREAVEYKTAGADFDRPLFNFYGDPSSITNKEEIYYRAVKNYLKNFRKFSEKNTLAFSLGDMKDAGSNNLLFVPVDSLKVTKLLSERVGNFKVSQIFSMDLKYNFQQKLKKIFQVSRVKKLGFGSVKVNSFSAQEVRRIRTDQFLRNFQNGKSFFVKTQLASSGLFSFDTLKALTLGVTTTYASFVQNFTSAIKQLIAPDTFEFKKEILPLLGSEYKKVGQKVYDIKFKAYKAFESNVATFGTFHSLYKVDPRKTVNVSLLKYVRDEQAQVAASLVLFSNSLREELAKIVNESKETLMLYPRFQKILKNAKEDEVAFSGLPAYQDIPLPRVQVDSLGPAGGSSGANGAGALTNNAFTWVNPDFFWRNLDDERALDLKTQLKFLPNILQYHKASLDLAYSFGMLPSDPKDTAQGAIYVKDQLKNRRSTKANKSVPGALTGSQVKSKSPKANRPDFFNRLPDSLLLSSLPQEVGRSAKFGKTWSGLNHGINEADHQKFQATYDAPVNNPSKPHLTSSHPLSPTVIQFGPYGMTEDRLPTSLNRSPHDFIEQFLKSLVTTPVNTHKMRRAFPAFKLYFIETDTSGMGGLDDKAYIRSYDDFFSLASIKDIKLVKSRKIPSDLLIIRLSNLDGHLDTERFSFSTVAGQVRKGQKSTNAKQKDSHLYNDTTKENPFSRLVLKEGMRVQFKFGYENDPNKLTTQLNGQIVQINQNSGDEIILVCQSFATQLVAKKKGLTQNSIPSEWVDTFELLSWCMTQPEMTMFGRWGLDIRASVLESRSTGGWEKVFKILQDPRDDNIFAPSRRHMITYYSDDRGGIWSYLLHHLTDLSMWNPISWITAPYKGLKKNLKSYQHKNTKVEWLRQLGDTHIYMVTSPALPTINTTNAGVKSQDKKGSKDVVTKSSARSDGKPSMSLRGTYGRGESKLLDYHLNKTTVWDVFQEMELRHPGWIARAVPYGNRMTMFFGLPNQLYWSRPMLPHEKATMMKDQRRNRLKNNNSNSLHLQALKASLDKAKAYKTLKDNKIVGWFFRNPIDSLMWIATAAAVIYTGGAAAAGWATARQAAGAGVMATVKEILKGGVKNIALSAGRSIFTVAGRKQALAGYGSGFASKAATNALRIGAVTALFKTGVVIGDAIFSDAAAKSIYYGQQMAAANKTYIADQLSKYLAGRLIPFRKIHFVNSENHIVANNIKSSIHGTYNAFSLEYKKYTEASTGSSRAGEVEVKTMKASDQIPDSNVRMGFASFENCRGRWMADRYLQGLLLRHAKDMYKGQLIILADPNINPHDRVILADSYTDMYGPIDVEQVVLTISANGGALTEITPDLVVYGNNMIDMPYDDYLSIKTAWSQISWSEALSAAVQFNGSKYQKLIKPKNAGNVNKLQKSQDKHFLTKRIGASTNGLVRGIYNPNESWWKPLFGSLGIKFYEWTTQRQPLIFQPLFVGGRPMLSGIDLQKVSAIQNFEDRFVPLLKTFRKGSKILNNVGSAIAYNDYRTTLDGLPVELK